MLDEVRSGTRGGMAHRNAVHYTRKVPKELFGFYWGNDRQCVLVWLVCLMFFKHLAVREYPASFRYLVRIIGDYVYCMIEDVEILEDGHSCDDRINPWLLRDLSNDRT